MFNIEHNVNQWCKTLGGLNGLDEASIAELEDHLHSEIEAQMALGKNAEQAFYLATLSLGDKQTLKQEFNKNRTKLMKLCQQQQDDSFDEMLSSQEQGQTSRMQKMIIGNAIIWAAAMIGSALLVQGHEKSQSLVMLLIGLWFASTYLFGDMKKTAKAECQYFRDKLGFNKQK